MSRVTQSKIKKIKISSTFLLLGTYLNKMNNFYVFIYNICKY